MSDTATLKLGDKDLGMPVLSGTVGPDVIDIRKLYGQTGAFTYDPGFTSTASCQSAITYIDGEAGILLHRGYPIDQLAEQSSFPEVSYLLLHGELPSQAELEKFAYTISRHINPASYQQTIDVINIKEQFLASPINSLVPIIVFSIVGVIIYIHCETVAEYRAVVDPTQTTTYRPSSSVSIL